MKLRTLYLAFCFVGITLPYWEFVPWVMQHGLNLRLLLAGLFANRISAFFGMDVLISAVVLLRFVRVESARLHIRVWSLPVLAVFTVGVSLALPLFLYLRELTLEKRESPEATAMGTRRSHARREPQCYKPRSGERMQPTA